MAGWIRPIRKAETATSAKAWTSPCRRGDIRSTNIVSRRCSLRCIASTAPSIATQMKANDTASSIQVIGLPKT